MITALGWIARQWWRGVRVLGRACACLTTALAAPILLANPALGIWDGDSWSAYQISLAIGYVVLAVPLLVAWDTSRGLDPVERCRQQLNRVEIQIDRLAGKAGIAWDETLLMRIDQMLKDGDKHKAYKVYHQEACVNWDEAWQAVEDWPNTRLERKIGEILAHLERRRCA